MALAYLTDPPSTLLLPVLFKRPMVGLLGLAAVDRQRRPDLGGRQAAAENGGGHRRLSGRDGEITGRQIEASSTQPCFPVRARR